MPKPLCPSPRAECKRVVLHVWDYLDDRLTSEATASLRAHIAECPECLSYQQFQKGLIVALGTLRVERPAPWHVKARVMGLLASEGYAADEPILPQASTPSARRVESSRHSR